jgi:hypothetical protein
MKQKRKKLEQKQHKTQEDIETLEQLRVIIKLVNGGHYAWNDVPVLSSGSEQRDIRPVNRPVVNDKNEVLNLKNQTLRVRCPSYQSL